MPKRQGPGAVCLLFLMAGLLLSTMSLTACSTKIQAGPYRATQRYSFETGLGGWQTGADVSENGDRPGPVAWSIEASDTQSSDGRRSARFFLDGKHDDGTIWLVRFFNVPADTELTIRLSFDAWSESVTFNTIGKVAAFAGARMPRREAGFDLSQPLNQVMGWERYSYSFDIRTGYDGLLWLAVGITAVWETQLTYYFDNLLVEIEAR